MTVKKNIPETKPKYNPGRPKAIIAWDKVDMYLKAGCTGTGIAGILGIAPITLYRDCEREHKVNFDAYAQQKRQTGDDMLRAKQFDIAIKGDKAMLIWLGKQRLGQRDMVEQKIESKTNLSFAEKLTEAQAEEILEDIRGVQPH